MRPKLMTAEEAAEFLNVKSQTLAVWRCTKRYPIPYVKLGSAIRYRQADLDAWIESQLVTPQREESGNES